MTRLCSSLPWMAVDIMFSTASISTVASRARILQVCWWQLQRLDARSEQLLVTRYTPQTYLGGHVR